MGREVGENKRKGEWEREGRIERWEHPLGGRLPPPAILSGSTGAFAQMELNGSRAITSAWEILEGYFERR